MPKQEVTAQNVITGKVRLNFPHVWETFSFPGDTGDPKYGTMILIPKTDKVTIDKLRAAQQAALLDGKDRTFGGKIPKVWASTIHDGDEEADLDKSPELEGHLYMSVQSKAKPGIVDQAVNPILDQSEIYSGVYARVSLYAYPYEFAGKKGVGFILKNIQKLGDGEHLSVAASRPEDDFEPMAADPDDEDLI